SPPAGKPPPVPSCTWKAWRSAWCRRSRITAAPCWPASKCRHSTTALTSTITLLWPTSSASFRTPSTRLPPLPTSTCWPRPPTACAGTDSQGNGTPSRYAVITTPGTVNPGGKTVTGNKYSGGRLDLTPYQEMTLSASHDIAEAATDPDINYSSLVYYDDTFVNP